MYEVRRSSKRTAVIFAVVAVGVTGLTAVGTVSANAATGPPAITAQGGEPVIGPTGEVQIKPGLPKQIYDYYETRLGANRAVPYLRSAAIAAGLAVVSVWMEWSELRQQWALCYTTRPA